MPDNPSIKAKALIVDDETDICYLLSSILRQKNFQTVFAGSISEAERILDEDSGHSIIFLDNHLPDGLGVNYILSLKKRCPSCIVVMITAHDTMTDRKKAEDHGVDFFIGKPFTKEIIFKTLEASGCLTT
jgi:two-component system OmpR family response regulator